MGLRAPLQARPIDMGLPSGVQWASCNVGAERPSDLGLFFSWGNIDGHSIGEGYDFSLDVYNSTPAAAINTNLSLDQDAARSNLGAPWRMPSADEFQELFDNCTSIWTTMGGVHGRLLTSNVNGNKLFFPAAGSYDGTSLNNRGSGGYNWSSTYYSAASARRLLFGSSTVYPQDNGSRRLGLTVRPVLDPA